MNCVLNGNSARTLAKAVQSLSKFGAELFIEADEDGLLLRSLNNSHSSIGSFKFNRHFFERYSVEPESVNYCKLTLKACFNAFRSMKQAEYCEIKLCVAELKLQLDIKCKHEQTKKNTIAIIDDTNISASIQSEDAVNTITASYKIFNEISSSFNAVEEEITLDVDENILNIKNYVTGARVNDKFMRTQFKLSPKELDVYEIHQSTWVTFCLKEFRAFLAFAESINENVTLQFRDAGSPLFMRIKKLDQIDCELVTSTLSPEDVTFCENLRESELMNDSNISANIPQKRKTTLSTRNEQNEPESKRHNGASETTLSNSSSLFLQENGSSKDTTQKGIDFPESFTRIISLPEEVQAPSSGSTSVQFYDTENVQTEDDINECINRSPHSRPPVRTIFSRCFEATYFPDEPSPSSQLFVPNSDSED